MNCSGLGVADFDGWLVMFSDDLGFEIGHEDCIYHAKWYQSFFENDQYVMK